MKRDILLCIDLQAYLQTDDLVDENKPYYGTLTLDDDYHAQFVERPCRAYTRRNMRIFDGQYITLTYLNPAKRNVLDLKNETCKNREKRNVLKISHTRHFKTTKKQSKTGCFYSF